MSCTMVRSLRGGWGWFVVVPASTTPGTVGAMRPAVAIPFENVTATEGGLPPLLRFRDTRPTIRPAAVPLDGTSVSLALERRQNAVRRGHDGCRSAPELRRLCALVR